MSRTFRKSLMLSENNSISSKARISRLDIGSLDSGNRGKLLYKPDDQLPLTKEQLEEEFVRVLTMENTRNEFQKIYKTLDTRMPFTPVEWSYGQKEFVKLPKPSNLIISFDIPGTLAYNEPIEDQGKTESVLSVDERTDITDEKSEESDQEDVNDQKQAKTSQNTTEIEPDPDEEEIEKERPKKLPNQFNFCERATLTYENPLRDISTQTVPPPTETFGGNAFQWVIFDAYQKDYEQQQKEKEKERKIPLPLTKKEDVKKKSFSQTEAASHKMHQSMKILERMVMQNIFSDIGQDYRYWDDPSDEFKEGEGSLLPLWKFAYEKMKNYDVTDLCFNSRYYDLFAVAFGTMSFGNATSSSGSVCLFSLKNPSHPEWTCQTDSPVMCLDFSTQHPNLLVIGTVDGLVSVYNVVLPSTTPQYKSNDVTRKHNGVIWQVTWAPDTEEGKLSFYSVGIDGKINYWILNQNDLGMTTVMTLYLNRPAVPGPDGTMITLKACGTCIAFHPKDASIFLVGTEEGTIYKCNTAYSSIYMRVYEEAHNMPIYRIVFNHFNSDIFASCSCDWRIKIWEDDRPEPLFMFDLGVPIGDIQWAPYSSTVFACVSNDGKVTVFDLNVNKYRPICSQAVVSKRKSKLTRLKFNQKLPFIIVGDDKGNISTFKLSPNLRKTLKPSKKQLHLSQLELECMKLDKLLSFVREPPVLIPPKDVRTNQ